MSDIPDMMLDRVRHAAQDHRRMQLASAALALACFDTNEEAKERLRRLADYSGLHAASGEKRLSAKKRQLMKDTGQLAEFALDAIDKLADEDG